MIIEEPLSFDTYEEVIATNRAFSELTIKKIDYMGGFEVSLMFMGCHFEIEIVHPFGIPWHPEARTIFIVRETECAETVLEAFISVLKEIGIPID